MFVQLTHFTHLWPFLSINHLVSFYMLVFPLKKQAPFPTTV
nr:MAG TPA: hypothetical protein [Caudoviricetes sp.]